MERIPYTRDQILSKVIESLSEISLTDTDFIRFESETEEDIHRMLFRTSKDDEFIYKDGRFQSRSIERYVQMSLGGVWIVKTFDMGGSNFEVRVFEDSDWI